MDKGPRSGFILEHPPFENGKVRILLNFLLDRLQKMIRRDANRTL